jgi:hypothetical protein
MPQVGEDIILRGKHEIFKTVSRLAAQAAAAGGGSRQRQWQGMATEAACNVLEIFVIIDGYG